MIKKLVKNEKTINMVYTIDVMSFAYTRVKGQLGEVKELISVWWRGRISWISNTHRHRDFAGSQTTEASWNNNHDDTGAGSQLPKLYLTKVIILSNFLCASSCRSGCGASTLIANKPHDLCGKLSSARLKINLSCQQHDGLSAPDLYSRAVCLQARAHAREICLPAVFMPWQIPPQDARTWRLVMPPKKSSFS